ncbi:hypothetical protein BH09GEM1_BH09GEM1_28910 [soil metagenome]
MLLWQTQNWIPAFAGMTSFRMATSYAPYLARNPDKDALLTIAVCGGQVTSSAKVRASCANGRKGGRPKRVRDA